MNVDFSTQSSGKFGHIIRELAKTSKLIRIAVAYVTKPGLDELRPCFTNAEVQIVCGIHGCISDLPELKEIASKVNSVQARVFIEEAIFHPKLYIFDGNRKRTKTTLIVGSPNFTGRALNENEEAWIVLRGNNSAEPISHAVGYFDKLWNERSVTVDEYLTRHPKYQVRHSTDDQLTLKQKRVLRSIKQESQDNAKQESQDNAIITFQNKVINTLREYGRQTIPTRFNDRLSAIKPKVSQPFRIVLPGGKVIDGRVRHGKNPASYYEIGVCGSGESSNMQLLRQAIGEASNLEYVVNLKDRTVAMKCV